jgi:hypothetical protein
MTRSSIRVLGHNIMQAPLLETQDANMIEFRDSFGDLNALLVRMLSDEMWGLVTKNDPDWYDVLIRYGYIKPGGSALEILRSGR